MKKRLTLILTALIICISCLQAQPRSSSKARELAQQFFRETMNARSMNGSKSLVIRQVPTESINSMLNRKTAAVTRAGGTSAPFYVFNNEAERRFVIVSGDERQEDFLGASDNDLFDVDVVPCGLLAMLGQYAEEYDYLQQPGVQAHEGIPARRAGQDVLPLIKTKWDQSPIYNDQCPMARGKRCLTGCVATSMAQMINFHQYPERGDGVVQLMPGTNNLPSDEMNLGEKSLNLQVLANATEITSSSSADQKTAVAYLMKACGYAIGMDYDPDGSSASTPKIPDVLARYFDYEPIAIYAAKKNNEAIWEDCLQEELSAGYPLFYRGQSQAWGGHSFLLDGYQASTGMYHFNWGWGGFRDGYFKLSSLTPGSYDFTDNQAFVARVRPKATVEVQIEKPVIVLDNDYKSASVTCATDGVTLYYSFTPQDATTEAVYDRYYPTTAITQLGNGTIRAYAEKKGKRADADPVITSWFKVDKPEFYPDGNSLTIKSPREDNISAATDIYYTTDGTTPTKKSLRYTGPITLNNGTTVKAIGVKKNFTASEIASYEYKAEIQTVYNFTNTAGQLSSVIPEDNAIKVISLTVAGELNSDDMTWILGMALSELSRLDMGNARIVKGGLYAWEVSDDDVINPMQFSGAQKLTSIVLPKGIKKICWNAFEDCPLLTEIEIPESCTEIGSEVFKNSGITKLHLPRNVKTIDYGIVRGCKSITSLTVDSNNPYYDSRDDCNAIIETATNTIIVGSSRTVIPSTVTRIGENSFCSSPTKFTIPSQIRYIEREAFKDNETIEEIYISNGAGFDLSHTFEGCKKLKRVRIPSSMEYIYDAFIDCPALESFTICATEPIELKETDFQGSNYKNATLYVPYGCKAKYQQAAVWKDFGRIEEMEIEINGLAELKAMDDNVKATLNLEDAQVTYCMKDEGLADYIFLRDASACYYIWGKGLVNSLKIQEGDYLTGSLPVVVSDMGAEVQTSRLDGHNLTEVRHGVAEVFKANPNSLGIADDYNLVEVTDVTIDSGEDYMSIKTDTRTIDIIVLTGESPQRYKALLQAVMTGNASANRYNVIGIYIDPGILVLTIPVENASGNAILPIVNHTSINSDAVYSLSGQRLAKPRKGINIISGRKVIIK